MNEKGVSNDKTMRGVSDRLDNFIGWKDGYKETSAARGVIHGVYHSGIGLGKYAIGNSEGAKAEFNRAGTQFSKKGGN